MNFFLAVVMASLAAGQVQPKSAKPIESPEHRHARLRLQDVVAEMTTKEAKGLPMPRKVAQMMAAAGDDKELFKALVHSINLAIIIDMCPTSLGCDYAKHAKELDDFVEGFRIRFELADACSKIYRQTIDKKSSDLTIRDTKQVTACQAIDSYPPDK